MSAVATTIASPDAAIFLLAPRNERDLPGPTLYFFKNRQYLCWDVLGEKPCPGYPRDIASDWPGLLEQFPKSRLRGALRVDAWPDTVFFFFAGQSELVLWDLKSGKVADQKLPVVDLLPGAFSRQEFTPVYAQLPGGEGVIYGFKGHDYARWNVGPSWPAVLEPGFPHKIADDWTNGLVLAPRAGVYVEWPNRSSAHSNRKIYFFMGDLYLRWDVPSNTRNYRLDIVAGWPGWPAFD
jgi:hypothetical protein